MSLTIRRACISAIVRLGYAVRFIQNEYYNYSKDLYLLGFWTLPELASGIFAACLPVTPRFFRSLKDSGSLQKLSQSLKGLSGRVFSNAATAHEPDTIKERAVSVENGTYGQRLWTREAEKHPHDTAWYSSNSLDTRSSGPSHSAVPTFPETPFLRQ